MGEVSRDDLQGAIFAEDFDYNEFVALITKHIEIQIPDNFSVLVKTEQADGSKQPFTDADNVVRQQLLDHVYDAIIELNKKEERVDPVPTSIGNPGGTKETVLDPAPTQAEPTEEEIDSQEQKYEEPEENVATDVSDSGEINVVDDSFVSEEKEPEIKINLNLGAEDTSEPSSAEDVVVPEKEEIVEVEQNAQGSEVSPDLQDETEAQGEATPTAPVSTSPSSEVEQSEHDKQRHPSITSTSSTPPYADRKSHIIALVKEKKWALKQITQIIDDQWGYAAKGKSSKTRVSKTIRDLRDNQLLYEESNGVLTWKGEG